MGVCIVCTDSSKNTGRPVNAKPFGTLRHILAVSFKDSTGAINAILAGDDLNPAYFTDKINELDLTKRFLPIMDIESVEAPRAENTFNEYPSGKKVLVRKGIRSFSSMLPETTSQYAAQIDSVGSCGATGVFLIDECGNIRGNAGTVGELRPLKISDGTWVALLAWATDVTEQNTALTFDFDKSEFDIDLGNITDGSITADLDSLEGLLDIEITNLTSSAAADTLSFDVETIYGDTFDHEGVGGLVAADIAVTVNGGTPGTITDVAEGTNGAYVVTVSEDIAAGAVTVTVTKDGLTVATAAGTAV